MTKKKGLQRRISNNSMMKSNDRKSDLKEKKRFTTLQWKAYLENMFLSPETLEMDTSRGSGCEINLRSTYYRILLKTICDLLIQE